MTVMPLSGSPPTDTVSCVILQPSYIPWRGYFHQIQKADAFVFYDDVQYDKHGWRNRNRLKGSEGGQWITIPVLSKGAVSGLAIHEVRINPSDKAWARKHWASIEQLYGRAPYFDEYAGRLEPHYAKPPEMLADFTIGLTVAIAGWLGLGPRFERSSELGIGGGKTERLVAIASHLGATRYVTGPSARGYLDERLFEQAGMEVEYMAYDYAEYEQRFPPFDPQVSVLDLLFMVGPEAGRHIWG